MNNKQKKYGGIILLMIVIFGSLSVIGILLKIHDTMNPIVVAVEGIIAVVALIYGFWEFHLLTKKHYEKY